jgi:hypothetical protein
MPFEIADSDFSCIVTTLQVPYALDPKYPITLKPQTHHLKKVSWFKNQQNSRLFWESALVAKHLRFCPCNTLGS